ncbi:hypothetical protein GUITHDRAFT_115399 [Guillardia theta CCMP2712]|uniref:Uncharacterized protein n=1 Tax=Guillardia theta (strain CCMP2712) TaxID=905079 RepID=L1IQ71_GUITC|nr:hypothetical protein GUITHDRAFT_115399 [Guillardia theta CCMP2712]EKX38431.1 hypothetical protein GUITHDRAFT_115399 [Guillardia theta CCMP2712]|eukprot:XP_005825411.1 hypothetical protein GUITHDRAFT_115399 [Guillardia theta CCMP2712]
MDGTTTEVTPRIGTDIKVTMDGTMMASLIDRDGMSKVPRGWYKEDPETSVLHILAFIHHRFQQRNILLLDFVSEFDTLRSPAIRHQKRYSGFISKINLRRAIDQCGCLSDLSDKAFDMLASYFEEERAGMPYKDERINYEALCEVLQASSDHVYSLSVVVLWENVSHHSASYDRGTMTLPDRYLWMSEQLRSEEFTSHFKKSLDELPLARQQLSEEGEKRFKELKTAIMHKIYADRISARELLGDFDPYLNTSVSWMKKTTQRTPMINMSSGCISRSQYLRGMYQLTGRMELSTDDLNLIFNKYKKNGAFNYYAFCRDVDPGFEELKAIFHPGRNEASSSSIR